METNPVPAKAAMVALGLLEGVHVRQPLAQLTPASEQRVAEILEATGLLASEASLHG